MTGQHETKNADEAAEMYQVEHKKRKRRSLAGLAAYATELEATGDFRVLRRLTPLPLHRRGKDDGLRCAIIVDTETTGLVLPGTEPPGIGPSEIVSLGMVAIAYDPVDGKIMGSIGRFHAYREPSHPIPAEATKIHGMTDDDVRGCKITSDEVASFIALSAASVQAGIVFGSRDEEKLPLLVAHNAKFDAAMMVYHFPEVIEGLPWACSQTQISWLDYGYEGVKLFYLGFHAGFFYGDRHSALADADAVVELLRQPLEGRLAMSRLREAARQVTTQLRVVTRYDPSTIVALKARGYRWDTRTRGRPQAWCWEGVEGVAAELAWQRTMGLGNPDIVTLDCFERFRSGTGPASINRKDAEWS